MVAANLPTSLKLIFGNEGAYSNDPNDPGGPTQYGITLATLEAWRKSKSQVPGSIKLTEADVKALSNAEAVEIITSEYATPIRFNDLPLGPDYVTLDFAVNSGPGQSVRSLQHIVGAVEDSIMGVKTLGLVATRDPVTLINEYCDARLLFLSKLANYDTFGTGWKNRVERVRTTAIEMARGAQPPSEIPVAMAPQEVIAKAPPSQVSVVNTPIGKTSIVALAGAVATASVTIVNTISPWSVYKWGQFLTIGFTVLGTAGGLVVSVDNIRRGRGVTT